MQITVCDYPFSNYSDVGSGELLGVIFLFLGLLILLGLTSIYFRDECYELRKLIRENKLNKEINIIKKEVYKK